MSALLANIEAAEFQLQSLRHKVLAMEAELAALRERLHGKYEPQGTLMADTAPIVPRFEEPAP